MSTPTRSTDDPRELERDWMLHQQGLDDTIESTFPASDPLSTIPDPVPDVEHTGERKEPPEPS